MKYIDREVKMMMNFWDPVQLSIQTTLTAGMIVFIIGTAAGRVMSRASFRGKVFIETLFLLPLVLPPTVIGFILIIVFGKSGPVGRLIEQIGNTSLMFSQAAAVIAASIVAFPLMYQSAKAAFSSVNTEIEDAARVDGATEKLVFFYVTLPLSYRFLFAGTVLSFARALGEFGATLMFAGNIPGSTQTLPLAVYSALETGNTALAWKWVCMTILLSLCLLGIVHLLNRNTNI
jgi:molybdate transport system permease protein